MRIEHLSPKMRMILLTVPIRNEEVEWVEKEGRVVLTYPKNFTRFERFLHRHLGGPKNIRRPLDDKGTFIWKMCDGEHNVHDICRASYQEFKEDIEPVVRRVWGFIETLLRLNLITVKIPKEEEQEDEEGGDEEQEDKREGPDEQGEEREGPDEQGEGEEEEKPKEDLEGRDPEDEEGNEPKKVQGEIKEEKPR